MDKQFKIVERTFIPQVAISAFIIIILFIITYLSNNWKFVKPVTAVFFCIMIVSVVFRFYSKVKTVGFLQFDMLGITIKHNGSTIRYNFLDDKLERLKIKLIKNDRINWMMMNKLEIHHNKERKVFGFKVDSNDDFLSLKKILTEINENAKVILN